MALLPFGSAPGLNNSSALTPDGVLYSVSGKNVASTTAGSTGNVLTSNGPGVAPTFQAFSPSFTGLTTNAPVFANSSSTITTTTTGTAGQLFMSNGASLPPTWVSPGIVPGPGAVMSVYLSASTSFSANTNIIFDTVSFDSNSAYNVTTGVWTAPFTGYYNLSGMIGPNGTNTVINIIKNGTQFLVPVQSLGNYVPISELLSLTAGDTLAIQMDTTRTVQGSTGGVIFTNWGISQVVSAASGGGITRSISSISTATGAGSAASTDYVYLVSGTTTLTLPTAVGNTNLYTVKNTDGNVTSIATTSSQTIDGSSSPITITTQYTSLGLISNGTNWNIV